MNGLTIKGVVNPSIKGTLKNSLASIVFFFFRTILFLGMELSNFLSKMISCSEKCHTLHL